MGVAIRRYSDEYRGPLITVWERSVRATHDFLAAGDIAFYKNVLESTDFNSFRVYCAFDDSDEMIGLLGVAGSKLEMLFLDPSSIGKGVGRVMMEFALRELAVSEVDVNEQNTGAVDFYRKFGFTVYDRRPLDDMGKPYPVLKMRLGR